MVQALIRCFGIICHAGWAPGPHPLPFPHSRGGALSGSSCLMYNPVPYIPLAAGCAGNKRGVEWGLFFFSVFSSFFLHAWLPAERPSCGECRAQLEQHRRHPAHQKAAQPGGVRHERLSWELPLIFILEGVALRYPPPNCSQRHVTRPRIHRAGAGQQDQVDGSWTLSTSVTCAKWTGSSRCD